MKQATVILLTTLTATLLYAILRYNIVRSVSFDHLPLFISNKAIALSATILIGLSFLLGPLARFFPDQFTPYLSLRKSLGVLGFGVASLHAILALILLKPAYYPRLFASDGQLNFTGEISMLFGVLALFIFTFVAISSLPSVEEKMQADSWKMVQRLGYLAYLLVLGHVTVMGFQGWFRPESWQYGLMSISLISAMVVVLVLLMRALVIVFPKT